ncbi:MAG: hypothetical protein K6F78_04895 [Bacteroidaceae bacterium]|nr:hypothetical protein [Bacteroidaceae bacterium]
MENKKEKRVVQIEIDDNVKKLTITGEDKDQQVVMKEELGDDKLDQVAGGRGEWCFRQGRCPRLH